VRGHRDVVEHFVPGNVHRPDWLTRSAIAFDDEASGVTAVAEAAPSAK
jgi:hypothetical protein